MSKGTPIITIRLTDEWRDQLMAIANRQQCNMSDVIRKAITEYVWRQTAAEAEK